MKNNEQYRNHFLQEQYGYLWANVDRSMKGIWSIIGVITVIGTIIVAIHKNYLPFNLGAIFAFGIIFWAINVTIDLNAWHRRNLFFITSIEREFVLNSDYGKLLPKKYRKPKPNWITFYSINIITFVLLLIVFSIYIFCEHNKLLPNMKWYHNFMDWHWLVWITGVVVSCVNFKKQNNSANNHWKELFQETKVDLEN